MAMRLNYLLTKYVLQVRTWLLVSTVVDTDTAVDDYHDFCAGDLGGTPLHESEG